MPPIRVALLDLSPILTQIVTGVLARPDIRAEAAVEVVDPHLRLGAPAPDVIIVGLEDDTVGEDGLPPKCRLLLSDHPWARVLSLAHDGRDAVLHELHPHRTELGEASPQTLLEAIRGVRSGA